MSVFDEWSDRIEHRYCLRHLYANFKKKFGGGTLIRDLMMGAAKATYRQGKSITDIFVFYCIICVLLIRGLTDCVYVCVLLHSLGC